MEVYCFGCGSVLDKSTDRRKLVSTAASSNHVLLVWKTLVLEKVSIASEKLDEVISDVQSPGRICRKCFSAYDWYAKLHTELKSSLDNALPKIPLRCEDRQGSSTPKRTETTARIAPLILPPENIVESPPVVIHVPYRRSSKTFLMNTPRRKHMTKALARGSKKTVVDDCFKDSVTYEFVKRKLSRIITSEIKVCCSTAVGSVMRSLHNCDLREFCWKKLNEEMTTHAPLLTYILQSCLNTKTPRDNTVAIIGVCGALIFNHRFKHMNLVQKIISLILYCGHAGKNVYTRLHKLNLTVSHKSLTKLVGTLGNDFDLIVMRDWRDPYIPLLNATIFTTDVDQPTVLPIMDSVFNEESDEDDNDYSDASETSSESEIDFSSGDEHVFFSDDSNEYDSEDEKPLRAQPETVLEPALDIEVVEVHSPKIVGYTLCGDNIDKNVRRRYQRSDQQTLSLHYFHSFAVRNRIDFSALSDKIPGPLTKSSIVSSIIPSAVDDQRMYTNVAILISRVLVNNMDFFQSTFSDVVCWHIEHKHYKAMSTKSVVVPLGVILKNEMKGDEMVEIVKHLHQYVPSVEYSEQVTISSSENVTLVKSTSHQILLGGDQLTAARVRSAQRSRLNSETISEKLSGFIAVVEDWHTKANFLGLIWRYFYSVKSASDHGTLYQLRNLINRTSVVNKPLDDFNACDDFFELIVTCHILHAAMNLLGMKNLNDIPVHHTITDGQETWLQTGNDRKQILDVISKDILDNFTTIKFSSQGNREGLLQDKIYMYAEQLLTVGSIYLEFCDAIREGDGERVLCCYRYFLPMFIASGRKNYAVESFNMLAQHKLLSPRQSEELIWSRFVNVHGIQGHNIPKDLHMEHLNRVCKDCIHGLRANKTEAAITRVGKALGTIAPVINKFDQDNGVRETSGKHKKSSNDKDRNLILGELSRLNVFQSMGHRSHSTFKSPKDILHTLSNQQLQKWITDHLVSCNMV